MKYTMLFSLFIGLAATCVNGQDLNQRYYYNGPLWQDFRKVVQFDDSTFLAVTQSWAPADLSAYQTQVARVTGSGELLTQSTAIVNVLQNFMSIGDVGYDVDGEIIIGGSILGNNMIVKIVGGNIAWSQWLNFTPLNATLNDFFEAKSLNQYAIGGHRDIGDYGFFTYIDETALTDSIIKINAGDSISSIKTLKVYPSSNDGYYIITNQDRTDLATFSDKYFNILRLNDDLEILWNRSYSVLDESDFSSVYGFLESDTGFTVTGRHNDDITFLQFDTVGNSVTAKKYTIGSNEEAGWGAHIIPNNEGGYLIATGVPSPSLVDNYQSNLISIDALGNINWAKRYNPNRNASFSGINWRNDTLFAYGRVVENEANLGFWLSTKIGYEDCNYEDITDITVVSNTIVIDHSLPTIIAKIDPKQGTNSTLSIRSDGDPSDSSCVYLNDVVYPGDVNFDQSANIYDLLPIGVYFGSNGAARPNATIEWKGQWAEDWNTVQASGADIKHIDTDGNGTINTGDVTALEANYKQTHTSTGRFYDAFSAPDGAELFVDLPLEVPQGVEFTSEVIYGTDENPAEDVYGIAFVIDYSNSPIPIDSIGFEPNPSWLGTSDSVLYISKHLASEKRLEIGLVKNTGNNQRRGIGPIGAVYIVTEDNVLGRPIANEIILDIKEVKAISVDESILDVNPQSRQVVITDLRENLLNNHFKVFPNPASDIIRIQTISGDLAEIEKVSITNTSGQLVFTSAQTRNIGISHLASGIYWLKIETREGNGFYKLVVN